MLALKEKRKKDKCEFGPLAVTLINLIHTAFAETVNDGLGTLKLSILAPPLLDLPFSSLFTQLRSKPTFKKKKL